jgi:hypothetical protein
MLEAAEVSDRASKPTAKAHHELSCSRADESGHSGKPRRTPASADSTSSAKLRVHKGASMRQ